MYILQTPTKRTTHNTVKVKREIRSAINRLIQQIMTEKDYGFQTSTSKRYLIHSKKILK